MLFQTMFCIRTLENIFYSIAAHQGKGGGLLTLGSKQERHRERTERTDGEESYVRKFRRSSAIVRKVESYNDLYRHVVTTAVSMPHPVSSPTVYHSPSYKPPSDATPPIRLHSALFKAAEIKKKKRERDDSSTK